MISNQPKSPHNIEKTFADLEDTIQASPERDDTEKTKLEPTVSTTNCPKSSRGSHEENEEVEQGSTDVAYPEPQYPTGVRFVVLTISLMLAIYMVALDTTILCAFILLPLILKASSNLNSHRNTNNHNRIPLNI